MNLRIAVRNRKSNRRCPYCHEDVQEAVFICPDDNCRTAYHEDCAAEMEICGILGCGEIFNLIDEEPVPIFPPFLQFIFKLGSWFSIFILAFLSLIALGTNQARYLLMLLPLLLISIVLSTLVFEKPN